MATERYDKFWAHYLGTTPAELNTPGTSIAAHVGLKGYNGIWFFRRNNRTIVSAPLDWVPLLRDRVRSIDGSPLDASLFDEVLGEHVERIVGPAFQGYLATCPSCPNETIRVHAVRPNDGSTVESFRARCGESEWDYSGLREATNYLSAVKDGDRVVCLAGYRAWTKDAGDVCVLTEDSYRGKGFATAAAWSVVNRAVQEARLLLYQTLVSNVVAIRIAERIGYGLYATHIAVSLRSKQ